MNVHEFIMMTGVEYQTITRLRDAYLTGFWIFGFSTRAQEFEQWTHDHPECRAEIITKEWNPHIDQFYITAWFAEEEDLVLWKLSW